MSRACQGGQPGVLVRAGVQARVSGRAGGRVTVGPRACWGWLVGVSGWMGGRVGAGS